MKKKKQLYKLVKLKDNKFKGKHPNGIYEGYFQIGTYNNKPTIGECFFLLGNDLFGRYLRTSPVTKVFKNGKFKTLNSTYKLEKYVRLRKSKN